MPDQIEVGSVVQLKSGGPRMTVTSFLGDRVVCSWFDSGGKHGSDSFPLSALKLVGRSEHD